MTSADTPLRELGWQPFFEQQVSLEESADNTPGRVCSHHGSHVLFMTTAGELSVPLPLVLGDGQRPGSAGTIAVGDWFLLDRNDHRGLRRLERKTVLRRKAAGEAVRPQLIAANVDTVFIVSSCNQEFNLSRLERYLALVLDSAAMPVVVLTKADLCDDSDQRRRLAEALHPGLVVESLDARDPSQSAVLSEWCGTGRTVALIGSSGVGKSTLANAMTGLELPTSAIRSDDDKGRHTTTSRSMHRLKAGGWLIDNPGMRELQLPGCEQGVSDLFKDILVVAERCRFRNCQHRGDAGCALQAAVEAGELDRRRLTNYLKLQGEQARNAASLAERREQERKTGLLYKRIIADKKRLRG